MAEQRVALGAKRRRQADVAHSDRHHGDAGSRPLRRAVHVPGASSLRDGEPVRRSEDRPSRHGRQHVDARARRIDRHLRARVGASTSWRTRWPSIRSSSAASTSRRWTRRRARRSRAAHSSRPTRAAREQFGWSRRKPQPRSQRDGRWLVGQGVATAYYPAYRFPEHARVSRCTPTAPRTSTPRRTKWAWARRRCSCSTRPSALVCRSSRCRSTTATRRCPIRRWPAARARRSASSRPCRRRSTKLHQQLVDLVRRRGRRAWPGRR